MTAGRGSPWYLDPEVPRPGGLAGRGLTSFVGLAAQGIIRLGVSVAVGRLAGSAALGVVAAGLATAQFLILLWPTTSGQAASRFVARARGRGDVDEARAVLRHLSARVVPASAVLALVAVLVCVVRGDGWWAGGCVGALLLGLAGQQFTRGVHYGVGAVRRVVVLDIGFSLAGLIGVVAALVAGVRGLALLLPLACAYLALTVVCRPLLRAPTRPPGPALGREIDRFVVVGSAGTLASAGLVQLSILVAGRSGAAAAGDYAAATNLALPLTLVSGALALVLYPAMSEAVGRGDTEAVRRSLDRGFRGVLFVVVPAAVVGTLLPDLVVGAFYGPRFSAAAGSAAPDVLTVLVLAVVVTMVAVPCVNALTSADERGIVEAACASLAGLVVAAGVWGVGGTGDVRHVALGYATGVTSTACYCVVRAARGRGMRWGRPVVAALVTLAGALLVRAEVDDPWVRLGVAVLLAVLWVGALGPERRLLTSVVRPTS